MTTSQNIILAWIYVTNVLRIIPNLCVSEGSRLLFGNNLERRLVNRKHRAYVPQSCDIHTILEDNPFSNHIGAADLWHFYVLNVYAPQMCDTYNVYIQNASVLDICDTDLCCIETV